MPFNFPDPAVSTTATNPVTGAKYQWRADPGKWVLTGGPAEAANPPVTISLLPPEGPQKGDLWIHEESLVEYAWDGTQWFEVGSSCGGGTEEDEEEKDLYFPFVNSFRLVAPDDFNGDDGTATILTTAYDAGDDSYLSPVVKTVRFAILDLNDRFLEPAIEGDSIQLTPENQKEGASNTLYGELKVTKVINGGASTGYEVDFDFERSVIYTEGDIVHYRISSSSDIYVKKTGDTMTGALVMESANLDFMISGESLKDNNGDPVLDSSGKEKWDDSIDRFSHIESLPPRILRSDGTYGGDTSGPFGIRVEIDDGNTHRNRFVVGNRNGDMVTVTGGTGPAVNLGSGFPGNQDKVAPGDEGKVRIKGIATPDFLTADNDVAVNKRYVDERDEFLQQEIIELEEEIDALAPSVERGTWKFNLGGAVASQGQITMYDGMDKTGSPIGLFKSAQAVWLNELDSGGTPHGFANVVAGDLLELFVEGDADFGLFTVVATHDETAGTNKYWVIDIEFVRSLTAESKADNGDNLRVKIIKPPSGGTADGFVMKIGDQMTGELEINSEQADNTVDYNVPTAKTQDIRFTTKRLDTGDTSSTSLYKPGYGDYLVSSGSLMARSSLYTSSFIYGVHFNTDGTRVTKTPRIHFNRSYDTNGNVTSEYGALRWSGSNRVLWDNDKVEVDKPINLTNDALASDDTHAIHKGYVDEQIAALLAKIEELEMSGGQSTNYRFTYFKVAYPRSNSQLQHQIGPNELLTSSSPWVPGSQQNWKQAEIYFYICLPNEWQVNPTGGYIITQLDGGKYPRTLDVCNFTFSEVESRAWMDNSSAAYTVWKVEQTPTDKKGSTSALQEFGNQASVIITFYGGSLSKKTS